MAATKAGKTPAEAAGTAAEAATIAEMSTVIQKVGDTTANQDTAAIRNVLPTSEMRAFNDTWNSIIRNSPLDHGINGGEYEFQSQESLPELESRPSQDSVPGDATLTASNLPYLDITQEESNESRRMTTVTDDDQDSSGNMLSSEEFLPGLVRTSKSSSKSESEKDSSESCTSNCSEELIFKES